MSKKDVTKKDTRPIKILTLDTETRKLDGEIFRIGLFDGEQCFKKNSFSELKQKLLSYTISNNVHIFIHNLNFDLSKIIKELAGRIIWSESLWINNRPAIIKTLDYTFHDSLILLGGASLDKLCKDFSIENAKMDMIELLWQQKHPCIKMKKSQYRTIYDKKHDKKYKLLRFYNQSNKKNIDKKETMGEYFNTVDPLDKTLNEYLDYDCMSLYEIIDKVMQVAPITKEDFLLCPTAASLSMKTYQTKFTKYYKLASKGKWIERNNQMEEVLKAGYYGGRTEVFIPLLNRRGYHYDVNSEYPFVMAAAGNVYPIGEAEHHIGLRAKIQWITYCRTQKGGGIVEATVYSPEEGMIGEYPILPLKYDNKLIFPKAEFTGTWTFPELYFAQSRGVKILEIHQCVFFWQTADLFSEFVNHFKKLKLDNSPNGDPEHDKNCNPSLRQLSKNILNALYGKFATKRERDSFVGKEEIEKLMEALEKKKEYFQPELEFFQDVLEGGVQEATKNYFGNNTDKKIIGRMPKNINPSWIDEEIFQYTTYLTSDYIQVQISAYVTSYARIHLYKGFESIWNKGGKIYYSDTDSLVSDVPMDSEFIDSTEFGKWELEGKKKFLRQGIFYQPKAYMEKYSEMEQTPETAKLNKITIHTRGQEKIRWFNIAQEDVTKKFKGVDKDTINKMSFADMEYFIARTDKKDIDKIELVGEKDNKKNLLSVLSSIKLDKDPNTMTAIKKSINIKTSVPKRKFNYLENKSTPWAVDPKHPDYLKADGFKNKEYNEFISSVADYNKYDIALEEYGKMKFPNKKDPKYEEYLELDKKIRSKYFSKNGCQIEEVADFIECHPNDIFYDMKWYFRKGRK